ncbi:ADP-ribosylglycohydrolase family protein [Cochlodiniinecator piscidefendens]|uniref:ADP-ribosylglycohydrolase family protein n=1 Tax=Cochlodiniinecator piscidefendens TaxID=2715756 RepID=UPI00140A329F|nr:ADP-ribosylglycohydrolase family protein [Cochlodiniinecator piscidefendens]
MSLTSDPFDRACGALTGLALGDALGMPSQTLACEEIKKHYGIIQDFVAPFDDHPVSHGLLAGQITDDTEQSFLLAQRLIDGNGHIDEILWAKDLIAWEADVRARGLRDLLGPSSKAALDALLSGMPAAEAGRNGTTNGASMRISPVGISTPAEPMERLLDRVERACRMTHNTGEAIAAAASVAMVISLGIDGYEFEACVEPALKAAAAGQTRGYPLGEPNIALRISEALQLADQNVSVEEFAAKIGTSVASRDSIPAAFGVVKLAQGDPWKAALIAANIGDDTDTIGAISCSMAGACNGMSGFPNDKVATLRTANDLPVETIATALLALRNDHFPST